MGSFFLQIIQENFENLTSKFGLLLKITFFAIKTNHLQPIYVFLLFIKTIYL